MCAEVFPRKHKDASVNRVGGPDFEVVTFEIQSTEHVPERAEIESSCSAVNPFVRPDGKIFKGHQHSWEELGTPEDMVVNENDD